MLPFGMRVAVSLLVATLSLTARAQEIQITGPLAGSSGPARIRYLPMSLRGDLRTHTPMNSLDSAAVGTGGAFRHRGSKDFAWQVDFGYLRGVADASLVRVPVAFDLVFIQASTRRPDWEFMLTTGFLYDATWSRRGANHRVGGEFFVGIDRRVDPVFNRFVVEAGIQVQKPAADDRVVVTGMLRVGVATTFGVTQYAY